MDRPRLLRPVDLRARTRAFPPCALPRLPGTAGTRCFSQRIDYRQPGREKRENGWRPIDPHRCEAGGKIKGKKRHFLADNPGLRLHALVHAADIHDRDGEVVVMAALCGLQPFRQTLCAAGCWQRTGNASTPARSPSSNSQPPHSRPEGLVVEQSCYRPALLDYMAEGGTRKPNAENNFN